VRLTWRWLTWLPVWAAFVGATAAFADSRSVVAPLAPGAFAVGCSNVAQDFSRVPAGADVQAYWQGELVNGQPRYATDLLSDPANTIVVEVTVPNDATLFGSIRQRVDPYVVLVCYPTAAANGRADYPLPTGRSVPRMQRGSEAPIFADAATRYPVLLFSHGLGGSPISNDYIEILKLFAGYGYVVAAPFHGDPRYADVRLEDFQDALYAILHFQDFTAMQAVRPISLARMLDAVLAHPHYRDHVDGSRIGGFGASLGGESLALLGGAALTSSPGLASKQVIRDTRLRAAVGYIPYFGIDLFPAFGRDNKGLAQLSTPYLALSGTADTTAPISATALGFASITGTRQLVALGGLTHGFDPRFTTDIFTWSLMFLAGQLNADPAARAASARMTTVSGGGDDRLLIDYAAPSAPAADERLVVEFRNASLDHYFVTAESAEAAMLDAGVVVPGWTRTTFAFKAWPAEDARGLPACRFFGTPGVGPNSHFYTIDPAECAKVKVNPNWTYEGIAFRATAPSAGECAADRVPVVRLYNDGKGGQANHRFTTSHSEVQRMVAQGWTIEGPVFCALP